MENQEGINLEEVRSKLDPIVKKLTKLPDEEIAVLIEMLATELGIELTKEDTGMEEQPSEAGQEQQAGQGQEPVGGPAGEQMSPQDVVKSLMI